MKSFCHQDYIESCDALHSEFFSLITEAKNVSRGTSLSFIESECLLNTLRLFKVILCQHFVVVSNRTFFCVEWFRFCHLKTKNFEKVAVDDRSVKIDDSLKFIREQVEDK